MLKNYLYCYGQNRSYTGDTAPPGSLPVSCRAKLALYYRLCIESRFYPPVLKNKHRDFCDFKIVTGFVVEIISKCIVTGEETDVRTDHGGNSGSENGGDARDANRFYLFLMETWCMRRGFALGRRVELHSIIVDGVIEGKRPSGRLRNPCIEPIEKKDARTGTTKNLNERCVTEMVKESCKLNYKQ